MTNLIDMDFTEMLEACISLGLKVQEGQEHHDLLVDMFWDGHSIWDIRDAIDVENDREKNAQLRSL